MHPINTIDFERFTLLNNQTSFYNYLESEDK